GALSDSHEEMSGTLTPSTFASCGCVIFFGQWPSRSARSRRASMSAATMTFLQLKFSSVPRDFTDHAKVQADARIECMTAGHRPNLGPKGAQCNAYGGICSGYSQNNHPKSEGCSELY